MIDKPKTAIALRNTRLCMPFAGLRSHAGKKRHGVNSDMRCRIQVSAFIHSCARRQFDDVIPLVSLRKTTAAKYVAASHKAALQTQASTPNLTNSVSGGRRGYVGNMFGVCREYVWSMSGNMSRVCREYVGSMSGVCQKSGLRFFLCKPIQNPAKKHDDKPMLISKMTFEKPNVKKNKSRTI